MRTRYLQEAEQPKEMITAPVIVSKQSQVTDI